MKRLVLSLLLAVAAIGAAWGQKTYINVVADHIYSSVYQEIYVTGDLPDGIKSHYDGYGSSAMTVGVLLNLLAKEGFVVLLSRVALYPPDSDSIEHIAIDDQDVHEVARYNLQGMPVDEHEKGIQIVVYSNYTTKTVIIE